MVKKNRLELLDCQIEIILDSLEVYRHTMKFVFPKSNKNLTKEEELKMSLIADTYEQVLSQLNSGKEGAQKKLKKFA